MYVRTVEYRCYTIQRYMVIFIVHVQSGVKQSVLSLCTSVCQSANEFEMSCKCMIICFIYFQRIRLYLLHICALQIRPCAHFSVTWFPYNISYSISNWACMHIYIRETVVCHMGYVFFEYSSCCSVQIIY